MMKALIRRSAGTIMTVRSRIVNELEIASLLIMCGKLIQSPFKFLNFVLSICKMIKGKRAAAKSKCSITTIEEYIK